MSTNLEVVVLPGSIDAVQLTVSQADADWPSWCAEYMVREQAGEELPA